MESKNLQKAIEYLERKNQKTINTYQKKILQLETGFNTNLQEDAKSEKVKILERDLYYYKCANKDLKMKLKQVILVNHRLATKVGIDTSVIMNEEALQKDNDIPAAVEIS